MLLYYIKVFKLFFDFNRTFNLKEYKFIFIFFIVSFLIVIILLIITLILSFKKINFEKISAYECGFDPFDDARTPFEVHFYIIAILFLIFDLEIIYIIPWLMNLRIIGFFGFYVMIIFLIILIIGFILEWNKGVLNWVREIF